MSEPFFALRDVGVRFGGLRALSHFTMEVAQGSIHALIGPNGAGKSTVFNCVSRFYRPSEGDILFDGRSLLGVPAHAVAGRGIARTFQNIELCRGLTVLENVLVGMATRTPSYFPFAPSAKRARIEKAALADADALLERTGLIGYRDLRPGSSISDIRRCSTSRAHLPQNPSLFCSTNPRRVCATARSRRSTRCSSISHASRASPSSWWST